MPPSRRRSWFARFGAIFAGSVLATAPIRADEPPPSIPPSWPDPAKLGRETPQRGNGNEAEGDGPLDPIFDLIDPARLQREVDRVLGPRFGWNRPKKERPEVPELGEPVFFDLTRPLGAKKYSNEINYLLNPSTKNAPTLQVIEYEYAFADWNSAELDLSYFNGSLEVLTPFYQRTLGVGQGGRSVRGLQVSPDLYLRSGFVGGSAVYAYGWKPGKESRFSLLSFLGANRILVGGFQFPNPNQSRFGSISPPEASIGAPSGDRVYGSWRPTFNLDLFYKLTEKLSLGIENDLFFGSGRSGEYFSFPFLTWEAGQHAFFQVGGGYYHFESRDQFTFLLHLNFVNPSVRGNDEDNSKAEDASKSANPEADPAEADAPHLRAIRRWFRRHQADR